MSNTVRDIWIVFDGPPGPESGRFIETEDESGKGVGGGFGWNQYEKYWKLGPFADRAEVVKLEAQLAKLATAFDTCALERTEALLKLDAAEERAEKAEAEINRVDAVLERRDALTGAPDRVDKILLAIQSAKNVDPEALCAQLAEMTQERDAARAVIVLARDRAEVRRRQEETCQRVAEEERDALRTRLVAAEAHSAKCEEAGAADHLRAEAAEERAEKAEAENRQRGGPPGEWVCDKCAFALHSRIINAQTGDIGVPRVQEIPDCLNGCGPLRPETWKGLCDSYGETIDRLNESCKQERERAEKAEEKITQFIHGEDRPDAYVTQEEATSLRRELAHYKAGQKVGGRVEEIVAAHEAYREVKTELEECRQEQKKAKAEEI